MARNGFVLILASLVLCSLAASLATAQGPGQCPTCADTSKMMPIQAHGVTIFFDPVGRAYYYQGKKYAVLNDKNEAVLVPADAPPGENLPLAGQTTPQTTVGPVPAGDAQPAAVGGSVAPADANAAQPATPSTAPQSAPVTQVAARSATSVPLAASAFESPKPEQAKPQAPLAKSATATANDPLPNLVAVKTPLADQPVNVSVAADLAKLNGRWRASVRDFLGNTTVIEMELENLASDPSATLISQTTGQAPSESKRKVAFANNKLTLTDGTDEQVLGQIAEASTVRLRINGSTGEMLFTRSPAD